MPLIASKKISRRPIKPKEMQRTKRNQKYYMTAAGINAAYLLSTVPSAIPLEEVSITIPGEREILVSWEEESLDPEYEGKLEAYHQKMMASVNAFGKPPRGEEGP